MKENGTVVSPDQMRNELLLAGWQECESKSGKRTYWIDDTGRLATVWKEPNHSLVMAYHSWKSMP